MIVYDPTCRCDVEFHSSVTGCRNASLSNSIVWLVFKESELSPRKGLWKTLKLGNPRKDISITFCVEKVKFLCHVYCLFNSVALKSGIDTFNFFRNSYYWYYWFFHYIFVCNQLGFRCTSLWTNVGLKTKFRWIKWN